MLDEESDLAPLFFSKFRVSVVLFEYSGVVSTGMRLRSHQFRTGVMPPAGNGTLLKVEGIRSALMLMQKVETAPQFPHEIHEFGGQRGISVRQ